jgi:hypothetical protein
MRYVSVSPQRHGYALDPSAYLAELPSLSAALPDGARRFATDPAHYDFGSQRCVKDLRPRRLVTGGTGDDRWVELTLGHNCWKHEEDLTIRYTGVLSAPPADVAELGGVLLDEVLPDPHGCRHELACPGGTLVTTSRDLTASWSWAECPERRT